MDLTFLKKMYGTSAPSGLPLDISGHDHFWGGQKLVNISENLVNQPIGYGPNRWGGQCQSKQLHGWKFKSQNFVQIQIINMAGVEI